MDATRSATTIDACRSGNDAENEQASCHGVRPTDGCISGRSPPLSTQQILASTAAATEDSKEQGHHEQHEEDEEQDLRDLGSAGCDAAEAEHGSNNCNDQEDDSVVQHGRSFQRND